METKILGTTMPVLEVILQPGESIVAEPGELGWMTDHIQLRTSTQLAGAKGIFGALKRAIGGGGLFMTEYSAANGAGMVAFPTKVPGEIFPITIAPGQGYMVHRHGLLCATHGVEVSVGFQRSLGAGVFGGTGFILQKLAGSGQAWIELDGEVASYELKPGETLRVNPGHVAMFEDQVQFNITTIPGITNVLFGGDGLFLASLTGPGRVWLQSLPLSHLAHAIAHYLPGEGGRGVSGGNVAAGVTGGLLGAVMREMTDND